MRVLLGILRNSLVLAGVGLALVALLLVLATAQPWLGLRFSADGAMLGVQAVPDGPAAQAVKEPTPLQAVRLANGEVLKLEPGDAVEVEGRPGEWRVARLDIDEEPRATLEPVVRETPGEARPDW